MATPTASPLPIPGQAQTQNPLGLALQAVANGVPQMDPEVANGVAQAAQGNPDQAVQNAQAAQGYINASQLSAQLQKESGTNQLQAWGTYSATQQAMLKSAGYNPPAPHRSLFGSITHDLGQGLHDVLNAAGSPLRAVQHAERTLLVAAEPQGVGGGLADILHSPADWAKAWAETSNGEHYVTPNVQNQVQQKYGPQVYQLALKVAEGQNPANLVAQAPQAQQQALAQQIQSPSFAKAVAELNAGKVSLGRNLVQVLGINSTGKTAQTISGLTDAVTDWFGDPVNIGLKGGQAFRAARYFVHTGDDVQYLYKTNQAVQAAFQDIAQRLSSGSPQQYAEMVDRFPQLQGVLDELTKARLHTADDVATWFSDNVNLRQIIAGKSVSLVGGVEGGMLPHLSSAGQARLAAKGVLQHAIDYMADGPATVEGVQSGDTIPSALNDTRRLDRLQTVTGRSVRHLLTLTPAGDKFNPYSPNWFQTLRNVGMMSLSREQTNQFLYDYAHEATIGGKRAIYASMLDAVMKAAGVDHVPGWSDFVKNAMDPTTAEDALTHSSYGPNGIDLVMRNGRQDSEPILDNQLSDQWIMPNYKTLYAQTKKTAVLQATTGVIDAKFMDTLMNEVWKPLALARFGFSLRVAGEEAFGAMLRAGPMAILRARAAGSALAHRSIDAEGTDPGIVGRMWGMMTDHLPEAVKTKITTPTELVAAHAADATKRAMAGVQSRLAGSEYDDTARWAAENGILGPDSVYGRFISATERTGNFYDASMPNGNLIVKVWDHGKQVAARMKPTGGYSEYQNTNQQFTNHWYHGLSQLATSKWGRSALEARGMTLPERMSHVADTLMEDKRWQDVSRSMVHDGIPIDASDRAIALDHAQRVIQLADAYTKTQDGREIPGLADHLLDNRKSPTVAALDLIDEADRPPVVSGPELVPVQDGEGLSKLTNSWTKGVNAMFGVIGKQIDWISRQPMFIHNLAASRKAFAPMMEAWRREGYDEATVQAMFKDAVTDRALTMTTPFIHNPELRSQFEVITRNLMPFMFAQEQFYKRWARTMVQAPWAFRQAQLINQGVYHSGFTHTDPTTGQRYFIYPGAGAVQDVLTKALGSFGYQAFLPIEANLRGQVKMASPGLERVGLPSFGPLVVVPLKVIQQIFPEADGLSRQTATQSYMSSLVPSTVQHVWQDFTASPNNSPQFASAMMQAIQYLEASGHGIGEVATNNLGNYSGIGAPTVQAKPGDYVTDQAGKMWVVQADGTWRQNSPQAMNTYMNRVKNWTRIFLITRTLFGFNAPASPENLFDPGQVNEDYQTLLKELPYQQATQSFLALHPDATAYTVFQTKNQAGGTLPATAAAMDFMDSNSAFFNDHPLAGAFFIPQSDQSGKYDQQAYLQQLQQQLRVRRTPAEFWQEIAYEEAANKYFAAENNKNLMLNNGSAPYQQIDAAWTNQSQQFLKANPLFAQQLEDSGGAYTRADIENDLYNALQDPRLPENMQTADIRTLYNSYVTYQAMTAPYGQPGANTMSSTERYQMEAAYANQVVRWVAEHPDTLQVFQRLIQPALSSVLTTEASAQVAG